MTATEHRTVPDWLDIDKIVSPETRANIAQITEDLRALAPTVQARKERIGDAWARVHCEELPEDLWGVMKDASGLAAMEGVVDDLGWDIGNFTFHSGEVQQ